MIKNLKPNRDRELTLLKDKLKLIRREADNALLLLDNNGYGPNDLQLERVKVTLKNIVMNHSAYA